ncbi:hypothetical protein H0H87_002879 [Tephrocybe sp. NHM501043]|nr:hypothetical protein H0H87_002879 [Tephrocybe sp. NHM501043]
MSLTSLTITLNDGTSVPWLAFGTGTALYGKDAAESVRAAIDTGITHLDGAQSYNNEDSLGAGIKASGKPRSELYIVTKFKSLQPGPTLRQALEASLKKLEVEYVDLYLIHDPTPARKEGKLKKQWKEMEDLRRAGLAKSIGVSNYTVPDLEEILESAEIVPAVNQVSSHPCYFCDLLTRVPKIELHPYVWKAAEQNGITIASYSGQTPVSRTPGGPVDEVLLRIRERLKQASGQPVTFGQVLSKWLIQKGAIEFISTTAVPDLMAEEIRAIEEAGGKLHQRYYMRHVFGE